MPGAQGAVIGIGAALTFSREGRAPATPPGMRVRTRRFEEADLLREREQTHVREVSCRHRELEAACARALGFVIRPLLCHAARRFRGFTYRRTRELRMGFLWLFTSEFHDRVLFSSFGPSRRLSSRLLRPLLPSRCALSGVVPSDVRRDFPR